jgi:hypothetical protein
MPNRIKRTLASICEKKCRMTTIFLNMLTMNPRKYMGRSRKRWIDSEQVTSLSLVLMPMMSLRTKFPTSGLDI